MDKTSLWAPWQNGPYKTHRASQNTEYTKTQQTLRNNYFLCFSCLNFIFRHVHSNPKIFSLVPLNSLTTIDTFSWLSGREVTHPIEVCNNSIKFLNSVYRGKHWFDFGTSLSLKKVLILEPPPKNIYWECRLTIIFVCWYWTWLSN